MLTYREHRQYRWGYPRRSCRSQRWRAWCPTASTFRIDRYLSISLSVYIYIYISNFLSFYLFLNLYLSFFLSLFLCLFLLLSLLCITLFSLCVSIRFVFLRPLSLYKNQRKYNKNIYNEETHIDTGEATVLAPLNKGNSNLPLGHLGYRDI